MKEMQRVQSVDAEIGETLRECMGSEEEGWKKGRMCGLKTASCVQHRSLTHYSLYRVRHVLHYIVNYIENNFRHYIGIFGILLRQ